MVHCFAGKSRATTFTIAYMISEKGYSLKDALEHIWTVRPIAEPNPGFMNQLKIFELAKLGYNSDFTLLEGKFAQMAEKAKLLNEKKAQA